ncbi:MAG: hypothetical protein JWN86_2095 [Planctomycetota bacterium]|nr:hypothetical protein [Planctomycetota bacterium]
MSYAPGRAALPPGESVPTELADLLDLVRALPPGIREELAPAVSEAIEQARFRSRILDVARDALERLRLDLELTRFDLDLTRKEREELRLRAS